VVGQVVDDLRRIVHVLYAHSRKVERLARLTPAQAWLIAGLARNEPAKLSDLARTMRLRPSAVVRIVGRLEERGLVVRTRPSTDHRTAKLSLTHVGKTIAARLPAVPEEKLLQGLSELSPDRLQSVSDGLCALSDILQASNLAPLLFFAPVANLAATDRMK
jgi:DNA-binding MarR family transcriptional regulator